MEIQEQFLVRLSTIYEEEDDLKDQGCRDEQNEIIFMG